MGSTEKEDTYEEVVCRECGKRYGQITESHLRSDNCTGRFEFPEEYEEHYDVPLASQAAKEKMSNR